MVDEDSRNLRVFVVNLQWNEVAVGKENGAPRRNACNDPPPLSDSDSLVSPHSEIISCVDSD